MAFNPYSQGGPPYNTHPTNAPAAAAAQPLDPRALLNPRRSHIQLPPPHLHQDQSHHARLNEQVDAAPLEFVFNGPNEPVPQLPQYPGHAQPNGAGGMYERINNVEERTPAVLQNKRRKLESSQSQESQQRFANGGNSVIAHHLKEKRPDGLTRHPSTARVETVDLTRENGDDVVVVPAPHDQEICFGMVQDARVNCHIVPTPRPDSYSAMGPTHWPAVKIMLRRRTGENTTIIHAIDFTRKVVGVLDQHSAAGLAPLMDTARIELRTSCQIASRRKEQGEQAAQPTSSTYRLNLTLHGPRKFGKTVGKFLSQRGVWLRKPFLLASGVTYENPQEVVGARPPPAPQPMRHHQPVQYQPIYQTIRTVEEVRSEVMTVFDSLTRNEDLPDMQPDPRITTELLRHQKQGLYFMTMKEKPRELTMGGKTPDSFWQLQRDPRGASVYRNVITGEQQSDRPSETFGGILADMMGLGKTLSILSLVATSLDDAQVWSAQEPIQPLAPPPKKHGESSRDVPAPPSLPLPKLQRNGKATLLVCPLSTIANWEEQIKTHIKPGELSYYIYHGANRIKDPEVLANYDIVLTTYGSVTSEVTAKSKGKSGSFPLEAIGWFRVVLDEAHMIREQSTLQFKAICRLQANRRWAVTGTPVQNKLDDLAALLAFLRLKPFDEKAKFMQYITKPFKICDPEVVPKLRVLVDSITLRRLKDKIDLPPRTDHIIRLEFTKDELKLYQMFEQNAKDRVSALVAGKERMVGGKSYIHILKSILRLRLLSAHGKDLLNDSDLELVQGMTADSAIDIDSDDENSKAAVAESRSYDAFALMQETNNDLCIECRKRIGANDSDDTSEREDDVVGFMTACFHLLCHDCIKQWKREAGGMAEGNCPFCQSFISYQCNEIRKSKVEVEHEGIRPDAAKKSRSKDDYTGYTGPHTKTRALVEDLLKSKAESREKPEEPPFKSVVFSAWTSHLDLIEIALDNAGVSHVRLDGKMSRPARSDAMNAFREDPSVQVILVSISAGGLGLNLTAGNSVYVMEPQYNPAAEAQAVDRVHRLGQKRPVRTVRYIMNGSIEEKMLVLQEKKMKLATLSMDKNRAMDKAEAAKQKLMDLRDLFK